ncbi:MAG TPA: hypothetical protein V6D18_01390 [Thermosynechococcaceae cyanobacterium]
MPYATYSELEQEVSRLAQAIASRNSLIGQDVLEGLRDRFSPEEAAGITLISLERLIWADATAFVWAVETLLPSGIMQDIRRITSASVGKRLVDHGFQPGEDFSVDAGGRLLLSDQARASVTRR